MLACEISDATGDLTALFYGRSHIPGVYCGSRVRFRGAVGIRHGRPVMINPAYELLVAGEASPPAGENSDTGTADPAHAAGAAREVAGRRGARPWAAKGGTAATRARSRAGPHRHRQVSAPATAVMAISAGIAAAEIVGALISGSLVLLADAAHMAADAAGVGLSVLAAYVATRPATDRRTFGYARAEILAATVNALLLLGLAAFIITEAVQRLAAPPQVGSGLMIIFGIVALAGNGVSLLLLRHGQAHSLPMCAGRSAKSPRTPSAPWR